MKLERPDRVNWSTLKHILISPKHYRHAVEIAGKKLDAEDSAALQLGRLTHCAVYEPDHLASRYVTEPNFHRGMLDDTARAKGYDGGKGAAAEWDLANTGREVVTTEMMALARAMRLAVLEDGASGPLMCDGYTEYKIEWRDDITGIECRGRLDHVNGCLSDLKTTRSLLSFERDAARLNYHAQLAWYADGLEAIGIQPAGPPRIVAVENVPPHDVLVLNFTEEDLACGRRLYRRALNTLAFCRANDQWPGIAAGCERRIQLPAWATAQDIALTIDGEELEM